MDAIEALLTRNSAAKLAAPAPQGAVRERIFRAALRAPDHGRLQPWRFLVVEGEGRERLGAALAAAMKAAQPELAPEAEAKLRANPLRAPLVLVVLARIGAHPKVPEGEQLLSVACAAQAMLIAAHAEGFGAIWRTGPVTYLPQLHAALGLDAAERVLGFLYVGTPQGEPKPLPAVALEAHFRAWPG